MILVIQSKDISPQILQCSDYFFLSVKETERTTKTKLAYLYHHQKLNSNMSLKS